MNRHLTPQRAVVGLRQDGRHKTSTFVSVNLLVLKQRGNNALGTFLA